MAATDGNYSCKSLMNFSDALDLIKLGKQVSRRSWDDFDSFIFLADSLAILGICDAKSISGSTYPVQSCLCMKTKSNDIVVGWVPNQSDMLGNDWYQYVS